MRNLCTIDGCHKYVRGHGLCGMHLARLRRNGDPLIRSLSKGKGAYYEGWIVDHVNFDGDDCLFGPFPVHRYPSVYFGGKTQHVHRLMCRLAHGEPVAGKHFALHECGNKACLNPRHLRWGSHQDNMDDMGVLGERKVGELHHQKRLSNSAVPHIRKREMTQNDYSKLYGVSTTTIKNVQYGKTWKHVV